MDFVSRVKQQPTALKIVSLPQQLLHPLVFVVMDSVKMERHLPLALQIVQLVEMDAVILGKLQQIAPLIVNLELVGMEYVILRKAFSVARVIVRILAEMVSVITEKLNPLVHRIVPQSFQLEFLVQLQQRVDQLLAPLLVQLRQPVAPQEPQGQQELQELQEQQEQVVQLGADPNVAERFVVMTTAEVFVDSVSTVNIVSTKEIFVFMEPSSSHWFLKQSPSLQWMVPFAHYPTDLLIITQASMTDLENMNSIS